jgi:hypothetical protein
MLLPRNEQDPCDACAPALRKASESGTYRIGNWLDADVTMMDGFVDGGRGGNREKIVVDKRQDGQLR